MIMTEKKRGTLLTIWLILMIIFNGITFLLYLGDGSFITSILSKIPTWAIYTFGIFALLNLVFAIFLLMWKRWAFFALCGSAGLIFIINLIIGTGISSLLGLIGPAILYLIMRPKWNLFE